MRWIKVFCTGLLAAIMLVAVNSCGVPDPSVPAATAQVANDSTINNSEAWLLRVMVAPGQKPIIQMTP